MKVTVKLLRGPECTVEINDTCTVFQLKEEVEKRLGMKADIQKLVQQGRNLADKKTLAECNVRDGSKIFLVLKKTEESTQSTTYFDMLHSLLCKHFSDADALVVLNQYKKNFNSMLEDLSLDDIERLATSNLQRKVTS